MGCRPCVWFWRYSADIMWRLLKICLAKSTQLVYPVILALEWKKCEMCPRIHARKRSRKVLFWEAASLSFLKAVSGRQYTGSKQCMIQACSCWISCQEPGLIQRETISLLQSYGRADFTTSYCLVWTCFPLRDGWKRPSLHASIILTHKINLDYNKWRTCCCALAAWLGVHLYSWWTTQLSWTQSSTKDIIDFSQMARSIII